MMRLWLALFYFFYFAVVGIYVIFLPKVLHDIGYDAVQIGTIYAAAPLVRFLVPFAFKRRLKLNAAIYLASLMLGIACAAIFYFSVSHFALYLFANLLFGAAAGIPLPYVDTIALTRISKEHYGKVRLWGSIGFALIALWLGHILESSEEVYDYFFGAMLLTALSGAMLIRYDVRETPSHHDSAPFSLMRFWAFWLSMLLMQVAFGGFYNFFTVYETSHGIALETVSWLWSFGVLCEIVMLYFQGPLLRHNLLMLLKVATAATALRWLLLWFFPDTLSMLFLSQSIHALSFALYHTAAISYVYSIYTQKKLAQQFFLGIAFGLGGSLGAILAGLLYGENLYLYEALITLLALAMLFVHTKRKERIS